MPARTKASWHGVASVHEHNSKRGPESSSHPGTVLLQTHDSQALELWLTPDCAGHLQDMAPALFLRPNWENHSGPLRSMVGATATVSTFVTVEGHPYRPTLAGNGGFRRGLPCFPSSDSMRAVSSPAGRSDCVQALCPGSGRCGAR